MYYIINPELNQYYSGIDYGIHYAVDTKYAAKYHHYKDAEERARWLSNRFGVRLEVVRVEMSAL